MTGSCRPPPIMRINELPRRSLNAASGSTFDQNTPKSLGDTPALEPPMHRNRIEVGIKPPRVFQDRFSVRPEIEKCDDRMFHAATRMTNSVICQAARMEIDTKMVIRHCGAMATQTHARLSAHTRSEMTPERIGYRLMLFREALGLSPSQIADRLDIPRTYWSRFEGGKRAITDDVAAMLVERFGVTLDFLILGRWDRLPLDLAEKMRAVDLSKAS